MQNAIERYNQIRDREIEQEIVERQKLRREIEDYLRKYGNINLLLEIANRLGIERRFRK